MFKSNIFKLVFILVMISSISGFILSYVHNLTVNRIAEEYRNDFAKGLRFVFPFYNNNPDVEAVTVLDRLVYPIKKNDDIIGYAIKASSKKGYSGEVSILLGVDNKGVIAGVVVLKHSETPGLGDKITSKTFLDNFKGLSVFSKVAVKKDGGEIDEFTGATMSPRAVADAVNNGVEFLRNNVIGSVE